MGIPGNADSQCTQPEDGVPESAGKTAGWENHADPGMSGTIMGASHRVDKSPNAVGHHSASPSQRMACPRVQARQLAGRTMLTLECLEP